MAMMTMNHLAVLILLHLVVEVLHMVVQMNYYKANSSYTIHSKNTIRLFY